MKRTMMFVVPVEPSLRRSIVMLLVAALIGAVFATLIVNPAEAKTRLTATPSPLDFGGLPAGASVENEVSLKNAGKKPITITPSISGQDASSFSVPTDPITIKPRKKAEVTLTYTASGSFGSRSGSLDLKDKNGNIVKTVPLIAAVKIGGIEG